MPNVARIVLAFALVFASSLAPAAELSVSENRRYLLKDGEPFFYLADTGWLLFMQPTREEVDEYLQDRADKGFNVIMTMLIGSSPERDARNPYGEPPLIDQDPSQPNEKYFQHVDEIVSKANSLGLFVAITPSWSRWMYTNRGRGPHPFNTTNARSFGEYVGRRYKDKDVIWVIGGDNDPTGYEEILRAMVEGLDAGDGHRDHLMTFHGMRFKVPEPPEIYHRQLCSAHLFGDEEWLDFHGMYSGHQWGYPTYRLVTRDREMLPTRPVIDLEPCYENHPYHPHGNAYWQSPKRWDKKTRGTAALIREQAYWAMLAGAAGHIYGAQEIWQFHDPEHPLREPHMHPTTEWRAAMDYPGAFQMGIMRRLFESRPWYTLEPDQTIIVKGQRDGESHIQAARAKDGSFLFAYLPRGGDVTIAMDKFSGRTARAHWFNPRDGTATSIGEFPALSTHEFTTPTDGMDNDWVLVLEDSARFHRTH